MRAPLGAREAVSAKRTVEEGASLHGGKVLRATEEPCYFLCLQYGSAIPSREHLPFPLSGSWMGETQAMPIICYRNTYNNY